MSRDISHKKESNQLWNTISEWMKVTPSEDPAFQDAKVSTQDLKRGMRRVSDGESPAALVA